MLCLTPLTNAVNIGLFLLVHGVIINHMPVTLKAINAALAKHNVRMEGGRGYFYFVGGETTNRLDKTVSVSTSILRPYRNGSPNLNASEVSTRRL